MARLGMALVVAFKIANMVASMMSDMVYLYGNWWYSMPITPRKYRNTTLRMPTYIYERARQAAGQSEVSSFNEFVVQAIEEKVQRLTESEIDAAFTQMATDLDYQREATTLAREFERSDWEALKVSERGPSHKHERPKVRSSKAHTR